MPVSELRAEKISVTRQHQIIKGEEFIEKALSFLKKNKPESSICQWNPIRTPEDLILSGIKEDIKWSLYPVRSSSRNQAKVRIAVFANGKEAGAREVTFLLRYNCRRLVALVDILPGTVISPENVKIEKAIVSDNCRIQEGVILKGNDEALVILASYVEVLNNVKLITPDDRHITYCHHEVVRNDLK